MQKIGKEAHKRAWFQDKGQILFCCALHPLITLSVANFAPCFQL